MAKLNMVALGRVVLSRREHVIALDPMGCGLVGTTLRYPYEVRDEKPYFEDIPELKLPKEMLDLAAHMVQRRRRLRTCVPIASAIDRLAAGCGASEPVLSGLPSRFGAGAWSFDLLAFGARVPLAMNCLLFRTQGLPGAMRALPPFAAQGVNADFSTGNTSRTAKGD